ncbi:MAG TPA: NusA-like transcription termination signal-binding factor [Halobacteria archaeon]|nr:NusA-like transcription termination signal-binding factor [Halobacteria archaeon]
MDIKLKTEELRYIALFEQITNAKVIDCVIDDETVIFVVENGEMGLAIGKGGININRVKKALDMPVEVIEYSENAEEFIKKSFYPVHIKKIKISDDKNKKIAFIDVAAENKGLAIGKNGKRIKKAIKLAQRHCSIDTIIIN